MIKVAHLPGDIFPKDREESIIIHDYTAAADITKGRAILQKNAISLVISGEKTMHFAEKSVNIKRDTFHFLAAGNCIVSMNLSPKEPFRTILIFFDNKVLSDFFLKYDEKVRSIKKTTTSESYLFFRKDNFTKNYITSLELLIKQNGGLSEAMRLLKFEELMLHLLEKDPQTLLSFKMPESSDFDDFEIRKAVETNVANNVTLEELAFLCNISLSTFKRRFAKIYGTSPNKWLLQRRMEMAKDLLLHHKERPSEVYHKVGYENHSSFSQSFKQVYGLAPKDFQQQKLNVHQ